MLERCALIAAIMASAAIAGWSQQGGNLVAGAECTLQPQPEGAPGPQETAARLADLAGEEWVGWEPAAEGPMTLEVRLAERAAVDVIACHWRRMPPAYVVEVGDGGRWRQVAAVRRNTVLSDKIALHQFMTRRAEAVRLRITAPADRRGRLSYHEAGVSLRSLEAYSKAAPPPAVAEFLARGTPSLLQSRATIHKWRAEGANDALDEELLAQEIPTWEPIPSSLYSGKETGRIVNEKSSARAALLSRLCLSYARTGRTEYAQRAWQVLETIIDHYDRHQAFRFVGREWQAVTFQEPGYKLGAIPYQYEQIAEALSDRQKLKALYFLLDVADFQWRAILEFMPPPERVTSVGQLPNWMPCSVGALTMTAVMLRQFPQSKNWVLACDERFPGFFKDVFFLSDGTWWECSPAHHVYVLQGFQSYALAKHLLGEPIWDKEYYGISLAQSFDALAKTATPFGEYPALNDSSNGQRIGFAQAATLMGRGDMLYAWRAQPSWPDMPGIERKDITVAPPDYTSINMPAAGMAVLRDGWEREDAYLMLDYGPHGGGHGQLDKLSIILFARGHHWIPDAGCAPHYCIFPEQWNWHRQTISHNTVLVDERSQQQAAGRLLAWHTDPQVDFVCAEHDGNRTEVPMALEADGEPHTLTIRPRELAPFRLAAIQMTPETGEPVSLAPEEARLTDANTVDDAAAPGGKAIEFQKQDASASWALSLPAGSWRVRLNGNGRYGSHDSVYIELDGERIGESGLPDRKYDWVEPVSYQIVSHRRAILHPRKEYFLIHDVLTSRDGQTHKVEFLLHVYGEPAGQQPGRLIFRATGKQSPGDQRLAVCSELIGKEPVTIEQGLCGGLEQEQWKGKGYPGKGDPGWLYIPYLRLPQQITAERPRVDFFVVVRAFEGDEAPEISLEAIPATEGAGPGLRVSMGETQDTYLSAEEGGRCSFTRVQGGEEVLRREFDLTTR